MSWFEEQSPRKKWLVGVSGGADSVALLHLLLEKGFRNLVVCHLDHRLRGRASTGDAAFVRKLAERLKLPFEGGRVEVKKLAEEKRESIETAARRARHDFFRECAAKHRCRRVILAHHADDQAETVLWNLLRGSYGLKGMKPMQVIEGLELHRPLLEWRREELQKGLEDKKLVWREDGSNGVGFTVRNRLRNDVMPLLTEATGRDPTSALNRLSDDWSECQAFIDDSLKKEDYIDPQFRIYLPGFRKMPVILQRAALVNYLKEAGITVDRKLLNQMIQSIDSPDISKVNLPGGRRFRRKAGRAFVE